MTTPAPQITQEQRRAILQQAFAQFVARLGQYKLQHPQAVFNLLLNFAGQVSPLPWDATTIANAVYEQIKPDAHLYDRTSVGLQRQREGRPPQREDFVIRWVPGAEPPALLKVLPQHRTSWINEFEEREKEAEEHKQYLGGLEVYERARKQCPEVISQFQPTRLGRVDLSGQARVCKVLQDYLDKFEKIHAEDLAQLEKDKTFTGWRVNWPLVLEQMRKYADQQYNALEGRKKESERI